MLPLTSTLLLTLLAVLWPVHGGLPSAPDWTAQAAARFWTPERMAGSMPASGRRLPPVAQAAAGPTAPGPPGSAVRFAGLPTVGVLFSVGDDLAGHYCTASVVHSPGRDLILTAAHCEPGSDIGFVPQYRAGADRQPYGIWAVDQVFTDPRWAPDDDAASDYDVAFARVRPDPHGRRIEDATGANRLARTPGYRDRVTVVGYPRLGSDPADRAITCTATTERLGARRQLRLVCDGFAAGTSGSPWLLAFDARTRTGTVVGLIGGLDGGGPDDRVSYSPFFSDAVLALYHSATRA
ncbi:V8-like Glu-specific endopeptidase [Actinacidiphila paucisporea]|uniref:V8-like Glu-specific endopeptidase n=2 Tax=Actinacidiphila paucisporea TaxID=310782 RepID=A0A1M7EQR8_9ACTN|nr:V8-like Glu-specific endopeptidase [Actinacidiphila paucisporea]